MVVNQADHHYAMVVVENEEAQMQMWECFVYKANRYMDSVEALKEQC